MIGASTFAVGAIVATGAALQGSVGIGFTVLAAPLLVMLALELIGAGTVIALLPPAAFGLIFAVLQSLAPTRRTPQG